MHSHGLAVRLLAFEVDALEAIVVYALIAAPIVVDFVAVVALLSLGGLVDSISAEILLAGGFPTPIFAALEPLIDRATRAPIFPNSVPVITFFRTLHSAIPAVKLTHRFARHRRAGKSVFLIAGAAAPISVVVVPIVTLFSSLDGESADDSIPTEPDASGPPAEKSGFELAGRTAPISIILIPIVTLLCREILLLVSANGCLQAPGPWNRTVIALFDPAPAVTAILTLGIPIVAVFSPFFEPIAALMACC